MNNYIKKIQNMVFISSGLFLIACADTSFSQGDYYSPTASRNATASTSSSTVFDRMTALEKKNEALQKELRATTTRLSSMWNKLEEMEQNVRGIAGDLDASTSRNEELYPAIQERLAKLEGEIAVLKANAQSSTTKTSSPVSQAPSTEVIKGTAEEIYKSGIRSFQERDYKGAVTKFEAVINQYPKTTLIDNAYFWLGESLYQAQDYKKAILQYEKVIKDYPKSNKAPSAYLKQGMSFVRLNNIPVARIRLNDTIDKFPKSQEAARAKEELKKIANKK